MIYVMLHTALLALAGRLRVRNGKYDSSSQVGEAESAVDTFVPQYLRRFAIPQAILAVLALMVFHVQVINRISSGYPLWYLAIAAMMVDGAPIHLAGNAYVTSETIVRCMVMYALIQGGLFASFLPPA